MLGVSFLAGWAFKQLYPWPFTPYSHFFSSFFSFLSLFRQNRIYRTELSLCFRQNRTNMTELSLCFHKTESIGLRVYVFNLPHGDHATDVALKMLIKLPAWDHTETVVILYWEIVKQVLVMRSEYELNHIIAIKYHQVVGTFSFYFTSGWVS